MSDELLQILVNARQRGLSWLDVAEGLEILEKKAGAGGEGKPWIQVAEEVSGYTANQLRRFVAARAYLLSRSSALGGEAMSLNVPFSHAEILSRISTYDAKLADEYLGQITSGSASVTQRQLDATLKSIRESSPESQSPIAAGKIVARRFSDQVFEIVRSGGLSSMYGAAAAENQVLRWRVPHRYASPDFAVVSKRGVDALDCYTGLNSNRQEAIRRRAMHVAAESTFFTRFWVMLPVEAKVGWLFGLCVEELALNNVGIVEVDAAQRQLTVVREIHDRECTPIPDRRSLWSEYEKGWLR